VWNSTPIFFDNTTGVEEATTGTGSNFTGAAETTTFDNTTGAMGTTPGLLENTTETNYTEQSTAISSSSSSASGSSSSHSVDGGVTSARSDARTSQVTSTSAGGAAEGPVDTTPSPSPPDPAPAPAPDESEPFPVGMVAGVGGAVAGAGLVGSLLAFFLTKKRSKKKADGTLEGSEGPEEFPRLRIRIDPMYLWYAARGTQGVRGGERDLKK
jgi:hypothetical protein